MSPRLRPSPAPAGAFIDLPPPPLHVATPEAHLAGAPVVVHTVDGRRIAGALTRLGGAQRRIVLSTTRARHPVEIPFEEVRFVTFPTPLEEPAPPPPALRGADRISAPPRTRPYHILFRDGRERRGRALGGVRDHSGVHLFVPRGDGCTVRVFVPGDQISEYALGARLGDLLVKRRATSTQKVSAALDSQRRLRAEIEPTPPSALAPGTSIDSTQDLVAALSAELGPATPEHPATPIPRVGALLESAGEVSDEQLHRALAAKLGLPYVRLSGFEIEAATLRAIPADVAREHLLIPLLHHDDRLVLAMEDPTNSDALGLARFLADSNVEAVVASREDVQQAVERCYGPLGVQQALASPDTSGDSAAPLDAHMLIRSLAERAPVVQLIDRLLHDAAQRRASDIHIRPGARNVDALLRINGALVHLSTLNKLLLPAIVARIKMLGGMDIIETRLPQHGTARVMDGERALELRLSVIPTVHGESVVIRLLDAQPGLRPIDALGLAAHDLAALRGYLHRRHGLILVAGPSGSGKTSTLYSALGEVRSRNLNVVTVEDPVAYRIDGIEQVQVDAGIGLSFAHVLRNVLHHDPDLIMVGAIRDHETAAVAVESSLTGHLVLSALETDTSLGAISRMRELGIEPYLLSPTLLCVISQRLLRRNCEQCLIEEAPDEAMASALGLGVRERFRRGAGCTACAGLGTSGHVGVYEVLKLDGALREAIARNAPHADLGRIARAAGMEPLLDGALRHARAGRVALGEVYRVFGD